MEFFFPQKVCIAPSAPIWKKQSIKIRFFSVLRKKIFFRSAKQQRKKRHPCSIASLPPYAASIIKHIFGLFWLLKVILKSDSDIDMSSFLHSCLKVKKWNEWRKKNIQQRTNNSFGVTMVIIKINSLIFSRKLLKYYSIRLIKYVKEVYLMNCSVVLPLAQWSCIHKFNRIYRAFFLNSCKQRKIHSIFSKSKKSCEKTGRNN